jgi:hypothetical protein
MTAVDEELETATAKVHPPGVCRFCGCTDERACTPVCWWITFDRTVCSAPECFEKFMAEE